MRKYIIIYWKGKKEEERAWNISYTRKKTKKKKTFEIYKTQIA